MEFRFDATQQFQIDAVASVVGLLEGQPPIGALLTPAAGSTVVPNRLELDDLQLLENLRAVQEERGLPTDDSLALIKQTVELYGGEAEIAFPNFSIEMETGTGKTYVYLRTILSLASRYGLTKFVIVVPSVAVREGVLKTIEQTRSHFGSIPGLPPFHPSVYAGQPGQVRAFTSSNSVEVMVMTIQSFRNESNVIRKSDEGNAPPINLLQSVRPILILDEPQNMESEGGIAALAALNPLFALRYSATHRNPYNVIYKLTPFEAYRQGLVKRLEVGAALEEENANLPFIQLTKTEAVKRTLTATVTVDVQSTSGKVRRTSLKLRPGDDLAAKTRRLDYDGFVVDEVNVDYVRFTNNVEIAVGGETGSQREAVVEAQIRFTVEQHFRKQKRIREMGFNVKVLSLFFIDSVASFTAEDGLIRTLFIKAFDDAKRRYPEWRELSAEAVQASYFASKVNRQGEVTIFDKLTPTTKDEREAQAREFDLIMRDKERLLSFEEPVAFIFSHSALKEGWDNPNVFQICTLREVGSETERRQQIGRGVRLPVDASTGERVTDDRVNVLTIAASESYENYVRKLQEETEQEYGPEGVPPKPGNARKRVSLRLRKEFLLANEFETLWNQISQRTRFAVSIDSEKLINDVVADMADVQIRRPRVIVQVARVTAEADQDTFEAIRIADASVAIDLEGRFPLPNMVAVAEDLMESTSPPMRIGRRTVLAILERLAAPEQALANPHEFAAALVGALKTRLADQLVDGIKYERDGTWYEQQQFDQLIETFEANVVPSKRGEHSGGTHLYEGVVVDSETVERPFAQALEKDARVKLYVKLPPWFQVPTPIGSYNPDWAIVMQDGEGADHLYLVRETKGTTRLADLRPDERRKILCGREHFREALGVDFRVVASASQLPVGGV